MRLRNFCFFLCLLLPGTLSAQTRDSVPTPPVAIRAAVDTLKPLVYVLSAQPEKIWPGPDSMPGFQFRMYDPARRQTPDWATLGNLGMAARPLWFGPVARLGFDVGASPFALYRLKAEELRFYQNTRSFSEVFFSQGQNQDNLMFNAQLARTFSGGATFAFEYRTFNNLGQFRFQQAQHNSMSLGLRIPVGPRYEGYLVFCQNVFRQQDNGGIVTDTIFGQGQFSGPIDAEIRLPGESARTRNSDWTIQLTQHYNFTGQKEGKRALRATHTLAWSKSFWKFSDTEIDQDSLFFGSFLTTDPRGLRHQITQKRLDNSFIVSTFKQKAPGQPSDLLAFGLTHSWFDLYQEPHDSAFSNLFLTAQLGITPSERFGFTARGHLGMLNNFGEYQLNGALVLGLGNAGQFRATLLSQRRPASLLQYRAVVSYQDLWRNDMEKPLETSVSATYAIPQIGLSLSGQLHLVNNFVYFDQQSKPVQTTAPVQVSQLLVTENLRWRALHFDNTLGLQQFNRTDVLRLPSWFSKNSLYYAGDIFKKRMHLNAGLDFRLNGEFQPEAYQPLLWQFHLQDSLTQKPYPWLDVFIAFKVRTFCFFFRYENLTALWQPDQVFYQTAYHPQNFNTLRMGIRWRFMDSNTPEQKGKSDSNTSNGPPSGPIGPRGF